MIQPMMVPNLEIRNLSPPCKVFIAYFVHLLYFVYCCNVFPTSQRMEIHCLYYSNFHITSCKWSNKHLSKWGLSVLNKVLIFIIGANVIISSLLSLHMGYISSFNYPGGDALQFTNNYILENYKMKPCLFTWMFQRV